MWPYDVPHRGVGPHAEGILRPVSVSPTALPTAAPSSRGSLYGRAGKRFLLVPLAHPRRTDEPLWPRHPAVRGLRLQAKTKGRPRRRLADQLRGPRALLRQGRNVHRRHRHERGDSQRARRHLQPAGAAACARRPGSALLRQAWHPGDPGAPGGHDRAAQRTTRLPLLRTVRPRLQDGSNYASSYVQILPAMQTGRVQVIANAMARELITDDRRQGHRRLVHRQDHGQRSAGPLPHGGAGRQRLRIRTAAAQLAILPASTGSREFVRQGRTLSDGHGRL